MGVKFSCYTKKQWQNLCLDARKVNSCIQRETYPIPTLASVIDNMTGATFFSKTDMKEAYQQLELSQNSRYLTNFHTKKRIMSFKRLCCVFSHFSVVPPKGFMKAFKAFKKLFETPQRRVKIGTNIHSKFSRKQYINLQDICPKQNLHPMILFIQRHYKNILLQSRSCLKTFVI